MKTIHLLTSSSLFLLSVSMGMMACSGNNAPESNPAMPRDSTTLPVKNEVFGVARIEPESEIIQLTAGAAGKIVNVLVTDNQEVKAGTEILQLDVDLARAQLAQAQSKMLAQDAAEQVAQANLDQVRLDLEQAEKDLALARKLLAGNAETPQQVRDQEDQVATLRQRVRVAEAQYLQTQAQRPALEADIRYDQTQLTKKRIHLPEDGKILKVLVHTGEYVSNSTQILEYAPSGPVVARTEVDELFADRVEVGQSAAIYSQMTGEQLATGKVIFAASYLSQKSLFKNQSTELEDRRVREVKVQLDQGKMPLFGSRVDCRIFLNP